ncbi:hypothetical protein PMIN03_007390 [Paraphaeosphaeria minitans]
MDSISTMVSPYAVNPQPFAGKVIAITGTSRGTGLALSKYFLARGTAISMCATTTSNLEKAASEIEHDFPEAKGRYWTYVVDIGKPETVKSWISKTVEKCGKLDGWANVAAVEQREIFPITDLDADYFANLIDVNVVGTFNCIKEEMKVIKDGGSIVNVGSIASNYASAGVAAYVSAKHALIGLTKVAAFEGAPRGIRVNALCPPSTTPFGEFHPSAANIPTILKRELSEPWEIVASIAFLLGDESKYVTKAQWYVDGGWVEGNYSNA